MDQKIQYELALLVRRRQESVDHMLELMAHVSSHSPTCSLRLTILNQTTSGGFEFKISRLVVSKMSASERTPAALENDGTRMSFEVRRNVMGDRYF